MQAGRRLHGDIGKAVRLAQFQLRAIKSGIHDTPGCRAKVNGDDMRRCHEVFWRCKPRLAALADKRICIASLPMCKRRF